MPRSSRAHYRSRCSSCLPLPGSAAPIAVQPLTQTAPACTCAARECAAVTSFVHIVTACRYALCWRSKQRLRSRRGITVPTRPKISSRALVMTLSAWAKIGGNTKNLAPSGRPPGHQPGAFPPTPSRCSPASAPTASRSLACPSSLPGRTGHRAPAGSGTSEGIDDVEVEEAVRQHPCADRTHLPPGSRMVPCRPPRLPPRYPSVSSPELRWG